MNTTIVNMSDRETREIVETIYSDKAGCSPRFESVVAQMRYIGVWRYDTCGAGYYAIETSALKSAGWLEDGLTRASSEEDQIFYRHNFDDALKLAMELARRVDGVYSAV